LLNWGFARSPKASVGRLVTPQEMLVTPQERKNDRSVVAVKGKHAGPAEQSSPLSLWISLGLGALVVAVLTLAVPVRRLRRRLPR
jgi:hypothetical protein